MEISTLLEKGVQVFQHHKVDARQMQLQHLINRLHPVHRISQPRPHQRDHLVLPVEVVQVEVLELEDDKYLAMCYYL